MCKAAQVVGVSLRTAYKWLPRFRQAGGRACSIALAPHGVPHAKPGPVTGHLIELRDQRQTYRQIATGSQLAASTVGRLPNLARLNCL